MKLLLDSHAVIWFFLGDDHLSGTAKHAIENADNDVIVSAVTPYEIALKQRRRTVPAFGTTIAQAIQRATFQMLPISVTHAEHAGSLPGPHRDPWDRILMAQAELEDCTLVTVDTVFSDYGIKTLW